MNKSYEVRICRMGKPVGSKESAGDGWQIFDEETRDFHTVAELKEWLRQTYGSCSRDKIYRDNPDGTSRHVGYVYKFKNTDWSHQSVHQWYRNDWVEVYETQRKTVIVA